MHARANAERAGSGASLKEYLRKNGIRIGIILLAAALIVGLGAAARDANRFAVFPGRLYQSVCLNLVFKPDVNANDFSSLPVQIGFHTLNDSGAQFRSNVSSQFLTLTLKFFSQF